MANVRPIKRSATGFQAVPDTDILLIPVGAGAAKQADDIVFISNFFEGAAGSETLDDARLPVGPVVWNAGDDVTVNVGLGTFHVGGAFSTSGAVSLSSTLEVTGVSTLTGNVIASVIRRGTSDGSDNSSLTLASGGAGTYERGAVVYLAGNEHGDTGLLSLEAGNVAGGIVRVITGGAVRGSVLNNGTWILGPGTAAGSAAPGGIRAVGASQFDANVHFPGSGLWNTTGNVGVGTTDIESWQPTYRAIQLGSRAAIMFGGSATDGVFVIDNAYFDGAWKYRAAASAAHLSISGGAIVAQVAASGSADGAVTWLNALTIDYSGARRVGFYGTTPVAKQTGVAVSAAGIHAALVNLGLIAA